MKLYAGLDLSMDSTQVCIVDENGGKVVSMKVESAPDKIVSTCMDAPGGARVF